MRGKEDVHSTAQDDGWKKRGSLPKQGKDKSWAKKNAKQYELAQAPLIICTSAGNLTEDIKKVCNKFGASQNIYAPVFLRGGKRISTVVKSEPFSSRDCGRTNCFTCTSGGGGYFERSGASYEIECLECSTACLVVEYQGETGQNGYSRGLEHVAALESKQDTSPLWKHCEIQHGG